MQSLQRGFEAFVVEEGISLDLLGQREEGIGSGRRLAPPREGVLPGFI